MCGNVFLGVRVCIYMYECMWVYLEELLFRACLGSSYGFGWTMLLEHGCRVPQASAAIRSELTEELDRLKRKDSDQTEVLQQLSQSLQVIIGAPCTLPQHPDHSLNDLLFIVAHPFVVEPTGTCTYKSSI